MFELTTSFDAAPAGARVAQPALSPRESETLDLLARGFSCLEIARLQLVSVNTIRSHVKSIYAKLDVHSRSEAVFEAASSGLVRLPSPFAAAAAPGS